jgi:hypothetical protein
MELVGVEGSDGGAERTWVWAMAMRSVGDML